MDNLDDKEIRKRFERALGPELNGEPDRLLQYRALEVLENGEAKSLDDVVVKLKEKWTYIEIFNCMEWLHKKDFIDFKGT